jgi:hypothetical protein
MGKRKFNCKGKCGICDFGTIQRLTKILFLLNTLQIPETVDILKEKAIISLYFDSFI